MKNNNKFLLFSTKNQQVNFISTSLVNFECELENLIKRKNLIETDPIIDNKYKIFIKDSNYLFFLSGFVEGEGSNSVSISVDRRFKYGVSLQPVFNVSQHKNGLNILYSFKELFGTGSVVEKSGSPDIWVYTLKGYKKIIEQVIPFLEKYVQPFSCKTQEYEIFKKLVYNSSAGHQKNKDTLIEMVNLAYTYQGKGKYRKRNLKEVIEIINNKEAYFNKILE
jgi:hypothetical protein